MAVLLLSASVPYVSFWPFASFRGDAAIQSLFAAKRTFSEPRLLNRIYEYAP
jgi:hypothetical protein